MVQSPYRAIVKTVQSPYRAVVKLSLDLEYSWKQKVVESRKVVKGSRLTEGRGR